ncbi:hypothetical protein [Roseibium sp. SCP14]|uniref:hypothetical protein n=1 Tax=Roseibium sp. SCP14 TaxID=3141375 RepID=UPI00333743DD
MRFLVRNLHVIVFALFSVLAAVLVSHNPQQTVKIVRPVVEDAVELQKLAQGAYREIKQVSWREVSDEAVSLYVATLRMPTMLFERLAERLQEVERKMSQQAKDDTLASSDESLPLRRASFDPVSFPDTKDRFQGLTSPSAGPHL